MARGRPPKNIQTVERKIQFPEALDAELQLMLFSDLEQRVPYGALSTLVTAVMEKFVADYKAKQQQQPQEK